MKNDLLSRLVLYTFPEKLKMIFSLAQAKVFTATFSEDLNL